MKIFASERRGRFGLFRKGFLLLHEMSLISDKWVSLLSGVKGAAGYSGFGLTVNKRVVVGRIMFGARCPEV